ncbi:hypothetical protein [Mediterranea massiliensis]|uniref:hypothetical protein n=1 Tax=Mediterranea massiliensis TaxID=1841865 RepID=UPI0009324411|nr:hypothetical protein [Mediterranea massiliensis]
MKKFLANMANRIPFEKGVEMINDKVDGSYMQLSDLFVAYSVQPVHALLISHARPVLSLCMSSPKLVYAPPKSVVCPA